MRVEQMHIHVYLGMICALCASTFRKKCGAVYLPLIVNTRTRRFLRDAFATVTTQLSSAGGCVRDAFETITTQLSSAGGCVRDAAFVARVLMFRPRCRTALCCLARTRDTSLALHTSSRLHALTSKNHRVRERRSLDRPRDNARTFATRRAATAWS
jgi:hypothetical protein